MLECFPTSAKNFAPQCCVYVNSKDYSCSVQMSIQKRILNYIRNNIVNREKKENMSSFREYIIGKYHLDVLNVHGRITVVPYYF